MSAKGQFCLSLKISFDGKEKRNMDQNGCTVLYRIDQEETPFELKITDHILDNVYGQIGITTVERKLERLPLFKRLHNISQLGFTNLIFPCALHTRYVHSIGVMHMASEMAKHINENVEPQYAFSDLEIQILRLTGMLHDIGHYPMSHNIELAYRTKSVPDNKESTMLVSEHLKKLIGCPEYLYPAQIEETAKKKKYWRKVDYSESDYSGSRDYHHEAIGKLLIVSNHSIRDTVRDYFVTYKRDNICYIRKAFIPLDEQGRETYAEETVNEYTTNLLNMIAELVVGNYEYGTSTQDRAAYLYKKKFYAMIQIIHSELDADNIDYLLRDSLFSGTSYGFMDVSVLLNCLTMVPFKHKTYTFSQETEVTDYLVGVLPKGVGCVDQFFQNKYLAYTQMIMNKYVSSLEFMLLRWAQVELTGKSDYGIQGVGDCVNEDEGLLHVVKASNTRDRFLEFTDSFIMNELFSQYKHVKSSRDDLSKVILSRLTKYTAFEMDKPDFGEDTSDVSCAEFGEIAIAKRMKGLVAYEQFREFAEQLDDKTIADLLKQNPDLEKKLYSYRFEEHRMTKQLPYSVFFESVFQAEDGKTSEMDDKRAFQNHFFRLSNGIPVLSEREYILEWDDKYDAHGSIPELVVDCAASHLHNTYWQISVFLRRYKIDPFK